MSYVLVIKAEAECDLSDAVAYYDQQRPGLGDEFLDRVRETLRTIRRNPFLSAKSYEEIRQSMVRHSPYVVSYLVEGDRIVVLAISHGRRDPRRWQSRTEG
jgi:toxin ParE1/3/4